jgi:hypothetical protein
VSITLDSPDLGLENAVMSLGGESSESPGITLVESSRDQAYLLEPLASTLPRDDPGPEAPLRVLFFERGADVPRPMRRKIAQNSWEVVDAAAYPRLLLLGPDGAPYPPLARDIRIMIACALAMAELTERHAPRLDGREPFTLSLTVPTPAGPTRLDLDFNPAS